MKRQQQLAINAYIAGEKSMADTKKALAIYDKKLSKATSAENSKSIVTRMNEDKGTQRSDLKKINRSYFRIYGRQ